jgi:hypothetical protein
MNNQQIDIFLQILKTRFDHHNRHPNLLWEKIQQKLEANPSKLRSLFLLEESGGEPERRGCEHIHVYICMYYVCIHTHDERFVRTCVFVHML